MKVVFRTNIDAYKTNCWPENLTQVHRQGDMVAVNEAFQEHFSSRGLPLMLEVCSVIWTDSGVVCELSFHKNSLKIAQARGINLYEIH